MRSATTFLAGFSGSGSEAMLTMIDSSANYPQERSVKHRGAQLLRTGIVAGRSGKR